MEANFSSWFLGPYKVSKIGYGLFLYALQPAKHTSSSFMGAILKEYLVIVHPQGEKLAASISEAAQWTNHKSHSGYNKCSF